LIRVLLPSPLRTLARVDGEVQVDVPGQVTLGSVLDALEAGYPALRGTMRDQRSQERRPFIRFYAGEEDLSHEPTDNPLPGPVATGSEPLVVIGAMAGG
jgi:sulfur-carrier protein